MLTGTALILVIAASLIFIVIACAVLRWHPFFVLLGTAIVLGIAVGLEFRKTIQTMLDGGAAVFASIGLIIALGTVLGNVLEKTNAAQTIADGFLARAGKKRLLPGISVLGAFVGIPVFCDSGFIILSRLARTLSVKSGIPTGSIALALATGLYTTHVLVPPTPGPLAAAGALGMNEGLGWLILLGLLVSIPALITGYFFAKRYHGPVSLPPDPPAEETIIKKPAFLPAVFPILLPILLIAAGSAIQMLMSPGPAKEFLLFVCHPVVAILLGLLNAFLLLARPYRKEWNAWIQQSLSQAGPIILITVAGGALGAILKETPLAEQFRHWAIDRHFSILWLYMIAYLLAAGLKTAQGSSTAALIIASSILSPLLNGMPGIHLSQQALMVLCIGAGAMTVSHANDSYFWVINQYAGIDVRNMYRYFTRATFFMGLATLLACLVLGLFL